MMEKIKPCPFCGSAKGYIYLVDDGGDCPPKNYQDSFAVECDDCQAEGPWRHSKKEAAKAWNIRISDNEQKSN